MSAEHIIKGFELLEKVGEGGMASVWKARQISLDRIVAIKILSDRLTHDAADIERFHTEARAAAKLKHPGIVQVYDASAEDGIYYFVMEFVAGYTVGDWARRKGRLSEKEALLVAEHVAAALNYAWEHEHIVHCDIKPDNVMVDADGTVKVADLGLARTISTMNAKGATDEIIGTPAYISPEQASGRLDLDCRSDIYSLGATLYHLLVGKPLFEGYPQEAIMELQVTDTVADPFDEVPGLSKGVCWLLERMLCKDREHRQASWGDVLHDISRVRRGLFPAGNHPEEGSSTIQRSSHRSLVSLKNRVPPHRPPKTSTIPGAKRGMVAGVAALLVMALLSAYALHRYHESASSPPPLAPLSPHSERAGAAVSPEDSVERRAREMYEHALASEKKDPEQYEAAIGLYQRVLLETRGTKYSLMAQTAVNRLQPLREAAIQRIFADRKAQAEVWVADKKRDQAVQFLRSYDGPYAKEIRLASERWIAASAQQDDDMNRQKLARQEEVRQTQERTLIAMAGCIMEKKLDAALSSLVAAITAFPEIGEEPDWQVLKTVLTSAQSFDQRILDSFARQAGQTVAVEFISGVRQILVEAVENGVVLCTFMSSKVPFGLDQLALRERLQRMGADSEPDVALAKGILALDVQSFDHAQRLFADTHPLIATRLTALVQERIVAQQAGAKAEKKLQAEASSPPAGDAGVAPVEAPPVEVPVQAGVEGKTQRVLTAVVVTALLAQNSQVSPDAIEFQEENGVCRMLVIRDFRLSNLDAVEGLSELQEFRYEATAETPGHLRSIKALARLPLQSLTIQYTPIRDIFELRGMPLTFLDLTGTSVRDLGVLQNSNIGELLVAGTPIPDLMVARTMRALKRLDASSTPVNSGSPLESLPLQHLNLSNTRIIDFSFVPRLPQLEVLELNGCAVRSLSRLITPSLRSLSVNQTRIEDLSPLANSGITHLQIAGTPIRDFSPLKGLPLRLLNASRTTLSSLEPLTGMPLIYLDISGTRVTSIEPLAETKSLSSLFLSGSRVSLLWPLKGMSFKRLGIQDISVRDLGVLRGANVEEIWVDNWDKNTDLLLSLKGLQRVNGQSLLRLLNPK